MTSAGKARQEQGVGGRGCMHYVIKNSWFMPKTTGSCGLKLGKYTKSTATEIGCTQNGCSCNKMEATK